MAFEDALPEFPAPEMGFLITQFFVVSNIAESTDFYIRVLGARPMLESDPTILKVANTWLTLSTAGGPTDDKPGVTLTTPDRDAPVTAFLNIRVADIGGFHRSSTAAGAEWLTAPIDKDMEIRGCMRDPDGRLIEVGELKAR
jgi:catechol 2,3-dioxygenase-like lactoylglutathione lyase family enzyme